MGGGRGEGQRWSEIETAREERDLRRPGWFSECSMSALMERAGSLGKRVFKWTKSKTKFPRRRKLEVKRLA